MYSDKDLKEAIQARIFNDSNEVTANPAQVIMKKEHIELLQDGNVWYDGNSTTYYLPFNFVERDGQWSIELNELTLLQEDDRTHVYIGGYLRKTYPYTIAAKELIDFMDDNKCRGSLVDEVILSTNQIFSIVQGGPPKLLKDLIPF